MFEHFIAAQAPVYDEVLAELRAGRKQSHWMWFIFPQLRALGRSETARRFGLADIEEARAYAAHPLLGARLRECVALAVAVDGASAEQVFGFPDNLKFCSCLTLFLTATGEPLFQDALDQFYSGVRDPLTLEALRT
jgi:uncharacterized protein (DUF1810 family)